MFKAPTKISKTILSRVYPRSFNIKQYLEAVLKVNHCGRLRRLPKKNRSIDLKTNVEYVLKTDISK